MRVLLLLVESFGVDYPQVLNLVHPLIVSIAEGQQGRKGGYPDILSEQSVGFEGFPEFAEDGQYHVLFGQLMEGETKSIVFYSPVPVTTNAAVRVSSLASSYRSAVLLIMGQQGQNLRSSEMTECAEKKRVRRERKVDWYFSPLKKRRLMSSVLSWLKYFSTKKRLASSCGWQVIEIISIFNNSNGGGALNYISRILILSSCEGAEKRREGLINLFFDIIQLTAMPPKVPPAPPAPVLSRAEQLGVNEALKVKDTESEQFKLSMRKQLRQLKKTYEQQQKLLAYFQEERERINYNWIIGKKQLEDKKSEFINKQREIEDLKENHVMTLNLYKQKIKHILLINQDQQSELRKDVEVTLKQLEDEHRIKERALKTDIRALSVSLKEQELSQENYTFALKAENDKRQTELRQQFQRKANDLKKRYDLKMIKVRNEMENYRKNLIKQLQDKKDDKIKKLTTEHTKKYSDIKAYYTEITATNLDLIKQLKNEIKELHKKEDQNKRLLGQIEKERKELVEPLEQLKIEIARYDKDLLEQKTIIKQKTQIKSEIDKEEKDYRDLEYQYEVKMQSYKYKQKQRETLFDIFNNTVYTIQQREGLQNLILEKKITSVSEELQVKNLQLNEVLKAAHIDGKAIGAITKSIEEIENGKSDLVNDLQNQLQQIRRAHTHMVKAYEGKLAEFVIPVEQLGFDPLVPTNVE